MDQTFNLRISSLIADEVCQRGLHEYGSAYEKISNYWFERPNNKPFKLAFTLNEVEQLRQECQYAVESDWDKSLVRPYSALLRQIEKIL